MFLCQSIANEHIALTKACWEAE